MAVDGFLDNLRQGDFRGLGQNVWEGARDEWLGLDDFGRMVRYGAQGDFGKALKSLGAGVIELGGTALMVVPGANVAALAAKGGKAGKAGKVLNMLRPLTIDERGLAKAASSRGIPRSLRSAAPELGIGPELSEAAGKKGLKKLFANATDEVGYGRGGILGSLARGTGQFAGALPASQGPLVTGRFGVKAPFLSGKLGTVYGKSERDELAQLLPFVGEPALDPYKEALRALLEQYNSPYAAY